MAACPGIYKLSLMRDGALARIRVPGGVLTSDQARTVADVSHTHGSGIIDLTNRANLQLRGLHEHNGSRVAKKLLEAGLLCENPDVDRLRNITSSPLAGLDPTEIINVLPHAEAIDRVIQSTPATSTLSPKFSIVLDGGGRGSLRKIAHDIGFFARATQEGPVFELSLADTTTGHAIAPSDVAEFVTITLSMINVRQCGRMRDMLQNCNAHTFIGSICHASGIAAVTTPHIADQRPAHIELGHHMGNETSTNWLTVGLPLSRISADQLAQLANMSDTATGTLRLTPWQSIVLPAASMDHAQDAATRGFDIENRTVQVIACTGASGCERTCAETKVDAETLLSGFHDLPTRTDGAAWTIHLSGCPRGCAMPGKSDILALAQPESANYALHAGSRPSTANASIPHRANTAPQDLASAIRDLIATSA